MYETASLVIMLSLYIIYAAAENHDIELVKITKRQNEDVTMKCVLADNHEEFNRNSTIGWYYLRTCKYCAMTNPQNSKEWKQIEYNRLSLTLDNASGLEGFYRCKIHPYHVDRRTTLEIEIIKTFQLELAENLKIGIPEILDTANKLTLPHNSQTVLQCKCRSSKQKPTIKWFKQKNSKYDEGDDNSIAYIESPRAIKYFENFYDPLVSSGIKELDDYTYLSKLIINNITENSIYVCVAINYYGFVYKDFTIVIERDVSEDYESGEDTETSYTSDHKSFGLFLIPLLLFIIIFIQISTIIYLMIYRSIMKETNKHFV